MYANKYILFEIFCSKNYLNQLHVDTISIDGAQLIQQVRHPAMSLPLSNFVLIRNIFYSCATCLHGYTWHLYITHPIFQAAEELSDKYDQRLRTLYDLASSTRDALNDPVSALPFEKCMLVNDSEWEYDPRLLSKVIIVLLATFWVLMMTEIYLNLIFNLKSEI